MYNSSQLFLKYVLLDAILCKGSAITARGEESKDTCAYINQTTSPKSSRIASVQPKKNDKTVWCFSSVFWISDSISYL